MRLTENDIRDFSEWENKGYKKYSFDREAVRIKTKEAPQWVHFGAGNIFRAFLGAVAQDMLEKGYMDTGIVVAEGFDYEIIDKAYTPYDDLALNVTLKADGSIEKTVLGSIVEAVKMESGSDGWERLKEVFRSPSLQLASFTITEKGYAVRRPDGSLIPAIEKDLSVKPAEAKSYIGKVAALAYERFRAGRLPIAFVSMDNCSHNGTKLYEAVHTFALSWAESGLAEEGFLEYINDPALVSFTWSMIDKITPRPDAKVIEILKADGFEGADSVKTSMGTFVAPFVNAEETQYLVVEDWFPNGRPCLEKAGLIFTDRETVDKVEKMKVCTCLNPLHTFLAIYGCLLGYDLIWKEMRDEDLRKLVEVIGYKEGLPVVVDPGILDPKEFIDTVINVRISNVFMPDSPQRIATDTSQKLAIRYGETIKAYLADPGLDVKDLKIIPLVFAGWCRYLMAVDDEGKPFTPSDDPLLEEFSAKLKGVKLGDNDGYREKLKGILCNERVFGVDLYEAGLGETVEQYFGELIDGPHAVRETLHKYALNA